MSIILLSIMNCYWCGMLKLEEQHYYLDYQAFLKSSIDKTLANTSKQDTQQKKEKRERTQVWAWRTKPKVITKGQGTNHVLETPPPIAHP